MAVLHYISEMHELGHTRRRIAPQATSQEGDFDESQEAQRRRSFPHIIPGDDGEDSQERNRRAFSEPDVPGNLAKHGEGAPATIPGEVGGMAAHGSDGSASPIFGEKQPDEAFSATGEVMSRFHLILRRFEACYGIIYW